MSRLQKSNLLRWIFTGTLSKLRKCFPLYCVQGNFAIFPCTKYKGSMKIGESLVLSTRDYFVLKLKNKSYVLKHHIVQCLNFQKQFFESTHKILGLMCYFILNKCEVRRPNFKFIFLYVLCFLHFFIFLYFCTFCTFVLSHLVGRCI